MLFPPLGHTIAPPNKRDISCFVSVATSQAPRLQRIDEAGVILKHWNCLQIVYKTVAVSNLKDLWGHRRLLVLLDSREPVSLKPAD